MMMVMMIKLSLPFINCAQYQTPVRCSNNVQSSHQVPLLAVLISTVIQFVEFYHQYIYFTFVCCVALLLIIFPPFSLNYCRTVV